MKITVLFVSSLLLTVLVLSGCDSQNNTDNPITVNPQKEGSYSNGDNILSKCRGNSALYRELSIARQSTAKYHRIEKAIEDGYVDINVVVQNMGYHFMKAENIDGTFDPGKPPLLVYSNNSVNGKMRFVAVEYAVPYDPANPTPPAGFTGSDDVWEYDSINGLWECHAWVWYNNPDGIFSEFNPMVNVDEGDVNFP
jgi:hypothetical protein